MGNAGFISSTVCQDFSLKKQVGSGLLPELHGSTCSTVHRGWCLGILGLVTVSGSYITSCRDIKKKYIYIYIYIYAVRIVHGWRFSAATR